MKKNDLTGLEVAVIGMALKFPGANNPAEFWDNLKNGIESVKFFTEQELEQLDVDPAMRNNPGYVNAAGGVIEGKEYFDASFFGYTPEEAILMDPQTRLFHEITWKALEDSGYDISQYAGRIGIYAGSSNSFYWEALTELSGSSQDMGRFASMQLSSKDFLTTKISYKLNLKGPSVPVQTACSTSLVAVHMATRSLLLGECDMALAGGVTITPNKEKGYVYQDGMILSKDGHCRSFDADASGTVGGNGAGVVVLKLLKKALEDKDHIYAVIKGSAINNDGDRKTGYTAPSVKGQMEVVRAAMNFARVEPGSIQYVECHGTATNLGDPIELEALTQAFPTAEAQSCAVGCVKSNMGHLDSAAGIAGLIKTILCLHHGYMVPSINFKKPNAKIDLERSPFFVNTALRKWEKNQESVRRAGVSSFGIGGTNAHIIAESAPERKQAISKRKYELVALSAKTQRSLDSMTAEVMEFFKKQNTTILTDASYTLLVGRSQFANRRFFIASSVNASAKTTIQIDESLGKSLTHSGKTPDIVFLFPGGGAQYVNMAKDLYDTLPYFKNCVDEGIDYLRELTGVDYLSYLYNPQQTHAERIEDTEIALPLLFIIEYALAIQIMRWGLQPNTMIGHSLGEYVAACVADVFSYKDGLRIVLTRGKLMKKVEEGLMLNITASADSVEQYLNNSLSISAINNATSCVIGGPKKEIHLIKEGLTATGIDSKLVHIAVASHSPMMNPVLDEFETALSDIEFKTPRFDYISNVTGNWISKETINALYWRNHLRNTVQFGKGVDTVSSKFSKCLFVEVGPGNILSSLLKNSTVQASSAKIVNLIRHPGESVEDDFFLTQKIGELWLYGCQFDWSNYFNGEAQRISVPGYSFDQQRYWIDKELSELAMSQGDRVRRVDNPNEWFYLPTWRGSLTAAVGAVELKKDNYIIFSNESRISNYLIEHYKEGIGNIVSVSPANEYKKQNQQNYTGNFNVVQDFEKIFSATGFAKNDDGKIIFIPPIPAKGELLSVENTREAIKNSFYPLVNIVKALSLQGGVYPTRLYVVTSGAYQVLGSENQNVAHSMLTGLIRSISQENPGLICSVIDIDINGDKENRLDDQLLIEEIRSTSLDTVVALRNGKRWLPHYEQISPNHLTSDVPVFKDGGTYLITGGLGRIGFTIAEFLSRKYQANFVITGQTSLPAEESWSAVLESRTSNAAVAGRVRKIKHLQQHGSKVLYRDVDSADAEGMKLLIQAAITKFGRIDGVIHSTAITDSDNFQVVTELDRSIIDGHLHSKVYGLLTLQHVLRDIEYDFCLLMSSISSTLGGLGFAAYASANIFMDAVATVVSQQSRKQWLSVGWDAWEYWEDRELQKQNSDVFKMSVEEGGKAVETIINAKISGAVVHSLSDLTKRLDLWVNRNSTTSKKGLDESNDQTANANKYKRPELLTAYKEPTTKEEKALIEIWQDFFKYEQIGTYDNFFELGGNSLKGISLITIIHKKLAVQIPVKEFFTRGNVARLAEFIVTSKNKRYRQISLAERKEYYPLSSAQMRLYLVQQLNRSSIAYNETYAFEINGPLSVRTLEESLFQVINKHEIFRTKIDMINDHPVQVILTEVNVTLECIQCNKENLSLQIGEFVQPFEFNAPPYIRAGIFSVTEDTNVLVLDLHHIITDGISANLLIQELSNCYAGKSLEKPVLQYKDYAEWQVRLKKSQEFEAQRKYWLNEFTGEIPELNLPLDYPRKKIRSFEGAIEHFELTENQIAKIYGLASYCGITVYTVMLTIYNILLSRLSNQRDIVVGTPTSGRAKSELKDVMGMFVNTLVLRNDIDNKESFSDVARKINERTLTAFENQDYQYEQLVEDLKLVRDPARNLLFDVVFTFQNMESTETTIENLSLRSYNHANPATKFDIVLAITEAKNSMHFSFNYSSQLFRRETILTYIECFINIIEYVVGFPDRALSQMSIVSKDTSMYLLNQLNGEAAQYPTNENVLDKFEEQVKRNPKRTALTFGDTSWSYEELDRRATQVAIALQTDSVQPNSMVSIFMEQSEYVVVGIFGIMKAGCAYLPIDIHYPQDRVQYILEDSNVSHLLTSRKEAQLLTCTCDAICIDDEDLYQVNVNLFQKPDSIAPEQLLYVIYTSGTTGKPKGVMIEHRNVIRLLFNSKFQFDFTEKDVWTFYHSHAFDFSVWEMYGALLYGGRLVVVSKSIARDTAAFTELVKNESVTILNQTPTAFYGFSKEALVNESPFLLRYIIFGGEALTPAKLSTWYDAYPHVRLINMYGITETTVHVTFKEVTRREIDLNISNIGRPIPTLSIYILDEYQNLQPPGVVGELCVGGAGVARGYLNRQQLTDERFVNNPFVLGERMYRSGDFARLLENGEVEYIGRMDHQVKIRGYRIELGEIENQLAGVLGITDAVIVVIENSKQEKSLCAYFVAASSVEIDKLRSALADKLPDYMVPSYLVQIDKMPLTNHGKINKRALPHPSAENVLTTVISARNEVELELVSIWKDTLELDTISINSSFFHVGGDSIKAIRLVNKINGRFKSTLKLVDLYVNETIEKLALKIKEDVTESLEPERAGILDEFEVIKNSVLKAEKSPENIQDAYPMAEIELGMVFNYLKNLGSGVYHDQFLFNLTFESFDKKVFKKAIQLLVQKHEILRTGFNIADYNQFIQIVYKNGEVPVQFINYENLTNEEYKLELTKIVEEDIKDTFSDKKYPLWRMKMVKYSQTKYTLLLIFHHAILDGWSVASFMTELNNTYYQLKEDLTFVPKPLKTSYKSAVLQEQLEKRTGQKLGFWVRELSGYERLDLTFLTSSEKQGSMLIYKRKVDQRMLNKIDNFATTLNTSIKNVLFSAYLFALKIFSSSEEVLAGWVTNNRPLVEDGDKILGCFLNTVPVRIKIPNDLSWKQYVSLVDRKLLEIKEYETVPLFEIAKALGERNKDRNPFFDTLFNFVNFHIYDEIVASKEEETSEETESFSDGNQNTNTLFDFEVSITGNQLFLLPKYDSSLIPVSVVSKFCDYYLNILEQYVLHGDTRISSNSVMPEKERDTILNLFNNTVEEYDTSVMLHELFEKQVGKSPKHVALECEGKSYSYKELNNHANQLARSLRSRGVTSGSLVGIFMERSAAMIVSMLAIVKAGGAYVPMELNLPNARVARIVNDLKLTMIVGSRKTLERLVEVKGELPSLKTMYCLGQEPSVALLTKADEFEVVTNKDVELLATKNLQRISDSEGVAYIIFTSGSTGVPKGVVVKHKPVINIIEWINKNLNVSKDDKILFVTSIGFDLSVYDVFGMLAAGGTIRLLTYEELGDPKHMIEVIAEENITIWDSAPAAIQLIVPLLDNMRESLSQTGLRLIMLSGDWIPVTLPDLLRDVFKKVEVVSLGGATEATIWSNYFRIEKVEEYWKSIPYGKPTQNCKYYILNEDLEICPIGIAGDLYIGGDCLSSGYVNDLNLTAQKFLPNPFTKGETVYKTGDLARWFEDGNMEFLGRKDGQVKIRGFRIETGEIESLLAKHSSIRNAVVLAHTNKVNAKFLCAYIVLKNRLQTLPASELKNYLLESVPDYFVPDHFIFLEEIPVSANGKVDRKKLPLPEVTVSTEFLALSNPVEMKLAGIWVEILGLEHPVSAIADFFELGGHSLNVTALISQLQKHFQVDVSIRELFTHTTIKSQAALVGIINPDVLSEETTLHTERENVII